MDSETLIVQKGLQASPSSVGKLTLVSKAGREGCSDFSRDRVTFLHSSFCTNDVISTLFPHFPSGHSLPHGTVGLTVE